MGKITDLITLIIKGYRYCISSLFGNCCRFYPSCSSYALEALETHGTLKGCYFTLRRILRCHPFHQGGFDPIPEKNQHADKYD